MTINEKIFKLIRDKGITQYRLSKDIGVSDGHISDWKIGRSSPTSERLVKLAKYFDVSTDYLLGLTDNPICSELQAACGRLTPDEQKTALESLCNQFPKLKK